MYKKYEEEDKLNLANNSINRSQNWRFLYYAFKKIRPPFHIFWDLMMTSSHIPSIILHRLYKHFSADYAAECEKNSLIFHPQWMAKKPSKSFGNVFQSPSSSSTSLSAFIRLEKVFTPFLSCTINEWSVKVRKRKLNFRPGGGGGRRRKS